MADSTADRFVCAECGQTSLTALSNRALATGDGNAPGCICGPCLWVKGLKGRRSRDVRGQMLLGDVLAERQE